MQVAAAIVSYNPTSALSRLVAVLVAAGIGVEIVDNASATGLEHLDACREAGATITTLGSNTGVAGALAAALHTTTADWLLTLDQDSVLTAETLTAITTSTALQSSRTAIVAPVVLDAETAASLQGDPTRTSPYETDRVITSGALCRVEALKAVGGFRTDLVIDFVDWDLCVRLGAAGWGFTIEPAAILEHSIGRSTRHHVPLLGEVTTTNHTPDRQYYKYRNYLLLARAGELGSDLRWTARTALGLGLGVAKVVAFEDDKGAKLRAMTEGVRDGVAGRGGKRPGDSPRIPEERVREARQPLDGRRPVSVCMATYNGERYLRTQLDSILTQLGDDDELLIQDDGSSDETLSIIDAYDDPRIVVAHNATNLGVIGTFERCLQRASHDIVFLSDQDDEWLPGKVDAVVAAFADPAVTGIVTEAVIVDGDGVRTDDSYFAHAHSGPGVVHNFVKNSYLGCCLAIRRDVVDVAVPFPLSVRTHDGWIGITADMMGDVVFLPTPYLLYRRHGNNLSQMTRFGPVDIVRRRLALAAHLARITPDVLRRRAGQAG